MQEFTPFDGIARTYDHEFEENIVTQVLRERIQNRFLSGFRPSDHILELNCGTGTDALFLAGRGIRVTALDASCEMVRIAEEKLLRHGLHDRVKFHAMSFEDLSSFPGEEFDGALSNFGGLNCARDISTILREMARLLKPGSRFILCFLNRWDPWEVVSFLLRGRFSTAVRRLQKQPIQARVGDSYVDIRYFSPAEIARYARPYFRKGRTCGLSIISPPPGSTKFVRRHAALVHGLLAVENRLCAIYPFSVLGDHAVVELIREDL